MSTRASMSMHTGMGSPTGARVGMAVPAVTSASVCSAQRLARVAAACLCSALLAACAGNSQTAWELIQQQQEKQAMINHYEAEQQRKNRPDEPHLMLSTIQQSQQQGRYFASLAYIDAYIKKYGRNTDIDALQADALRMTGQTADSRVAYRALLKTEKAADGWHGLGLLAGAQGNFALAAQDLEKAAQLAPVDANILNDLGYARMRAGDLAGARVPLGKAAELDPQSDKIISNLALLLLASGQAGQAKRVMDKASLPNAVRQQIYVLAREIPRHPVALAGKPAAAYASPADAGAVTGEGVTASKAVATTAVVLPDGDIVRNLSELPAVSNTAPVSATASSYAAPRAAGTTAKAKGASAVTYDNSPIVLPALQPRLEQRFGNPYSSTQASN